MSRQPGRETEADWMKAISQLLENQGNGFQCRSEAPYLVQEVRGPGLPSEQWAVCVMCSNLQAEVWNSDLSFQLGTRTGDGHRSA